MAEKIVIASGKGGVGKSTCCTAIGRELVRREYKVLLVDTDVGLRSLDVILGVSERVVFDWGDLVNDRCRKEEAVIHTPTVDLLSCPLQESDKFTPESVSAVVRMFENDYDYILLDAPAGIGSGFMNAASCADRGLVISNSDKVCVRSAGIAADKLYDLGLDDVRLIINRFRKKSVLSRKLMNIDDVIDGTAVQLIGVVPEDENIIFGFVMTNKSQLSYKPFVRITNRLLGESDPLLINF